jgi:hypothetical protein
MPEKTEYTPGTFCWSELSTTDPAAAKAFYTSLFGWTATDTPAGHGIYTMLHLDGKEAGALNELQKTQRDAGVPSHWLLYLSVASADETLAKVAELGGKVLAGPFDVMEFGRMGVAQDPTGATFAIWQPKKHIGARVTGEPGAACWNELATRDTEAAGAFYTKVFGWTDLTKQMGPMTYTSFMQGETPTGGMLKMTEEWAGIPPHWMVYFAVADCDAGAARARELGGEVKVPPTDIPEVGRFAVIQDPQGAVFSIIKLAARA